MDIYNLVTADLDDLEKWGKDLIGKLPPAGSMIPADLYLQNIAIQILAIAQLEYFLKEKGIIKKQEEILNKIKKSSLNQLEKDHLIVLFLIRHSLVHMGGTVDEKLLCDFKKHILQLKINYKKGDLSSLATENLLLYIELIKKLIKEYN